MLPTHCSEFCHNQFISASASTAGAQLGEQGRPLPALGSTAGTGGGQNSCRSSQSLSQNQHRATLVWCWLWYSTGRLVCFVRSLWCTSTWLLGGGKVNVFIFKWNWTQSYISIVFHRWLWNPEWGPIPQFQVYFWGKGVMFFRGFTFQYFTLAIWLLGSPHKTVPLVLEIWTARFGELSCNNTPRQLSSCLWDEEKDSCQDCCVQIVLYPRSFSILFVFCVHKHGLTSVWRSNKWSLPPPPEFLFKL